MELVRLTTFINLFPEKIARTNVRHSPRSAYETSTLLADRHNLFLKTKILTLFLRSFFFFFSFSISLPFSLLSIILDSFWFRLFLDFFIIFFFLQVFKFF